MIFFCNSDFADHPMKINILLLQNKYLIFTSYLESGRTLKTEFPTPSLSVKVSILFVRIYFYVHRATLFYRFQNT